MKKIDVMPDGSEIVHYDQKGIPLSINIFDLSSYPNKRALCHWHEDIELIRILEGTMYYYVNGHKVLLTENDCILVNTKQMHYGYANQNQDCKFICILFQANILSANTSLYTTYISPFLENHQLEYILFHGNGDAVTNILTLVDQIAELKQQNTTGYELTVNGLLNILWSHLLQNTNLQLHSQQKMDNNLLSQRAMVSYIHQHYNEKLTLPDIAAAGNVCRNKCCLIFREYNRQSPIDFLNSYRLKVSCDLLIHSTDSITDIALTCGFHHSSYYSKMFMREYGCTPSEYRKQNSL